jgi:hypothetical protein
MWYAIIAAVFLAVGIGLMVWALRERSKRHKAERAMDKALAAEKAVSIIAEQNATRAAVLDKQNERLDEQLSLIRDRLRIERERLAKSGDPTAIKAWLDEELEGGEV